MQKLAMSQHHRRWYARPPAGTLDCPGVHPLFDSEGCHHAQSLRGSFEDKTDFSRQNVLTSVGSPFIQINRSQNHLTDALL